MKAEELMRFDWVHLTDDNTPRQVDWIKSGEVGLFWGQTVTPPYLEPIPLTAEILEKNGFHKQKWNDLVTEFVFATDLKQSPQTVIQFTFYSKEIEGVRSLLKMWTKSKFGHGQNDVHLCGIYYFHELQHALRLCGIDKTIEII